MYLLYKATTDPANFEVYTHIVLNMLVALPIFLAILFVTAAIRAYRDYRKAISLKKFLKENTFEEDLGSQIQSR